MMNAVGRLLLWGWVVVAGSASAAAPARDDFAVPSLHVVWGKERHAGPEDLSASARLRSDGQALLLEVDVTDDRLVFNGHPVHSDHVEVWLSLPQEEDVRGTQYLAVGSNELFDLANPRALRDRVQQASPICEEEEEDMVEEPPPPSRQEVAAARRPYLAMKPRPLQAFWGMVHFGLIPGRTEPLLYEAENYASLKPGIGALADLSRYVSFQVERTERGYRVSARLQPEALGFTTWTGLEKLRVMVDVVDVDAGSKQETLASTSAQRRWGEPTTFTPVSLALPLPVAISKHHPPLGSKAVQDEPLAPFFLLFPRLYMLTTEGWVGAAREHRAEEPRLSGGCSLALGFSRVRFLRLPLPGPLSETPSWRRAGDTPVWSFGLSSVEGPWEVATRVVLVGGEWATVAAEAVEAFVLPDGAPAVLVVHSEYVRPGARRGPCASSMVHELELRRREGSLIRSTQLASFADCSNEFLVAGKKQPWVDPPEDWSQAFRWKEPGRTLALDFGGEESYAVEWDEHGQNVRMQPARPATAEASP